MSFIQVSWLELGRDENRLVTFWTVCCGCRSRVKVVNLLTFDKHAIPSSQTETVKGSDILTSFKIFPHKRENIFNLAFPASTATKLFSSIYATPVKYGFCLSSFAVKSRRFVILISYFLFISLFPLHFLMSSSDVCLALSDK